MVAGERMVGSDGKEVMLFPLPYMYISQGELETYSHAGILAIDFLGWDNNGRVYQAPMYAPCTCTCVNTIDATNKGRIFQSVGQVHTPQGLKTVTFMFFHDNNPIAMIGSRFNQGDLIGHTGTAGVDQYSDHTHFNTANVMYNPLNYWENVPPDNHGELVGSSHVYDTCYINGTVLVEDYGYPWKSYTGFASTYFKKFPWVLYSKYRQYMWYEDLQNNVK